MPRKRSGVVTRPDQHRKKKSPNGARATFRGIRSFWVHESNPDPMPVKTFVPHIEPHLRQALLKYGGESKIHEDIWQLVERLENDGSAIQIPHVQAYANFIGVQSSLLALFAQFVSEEHTKEDSYKQTMIAKIHGFHAALEVMESAIRGSDRDVLSSTFPSSDEPSSPPELYANIDLLRSIVKAYQAGRAKAVAMP